MAAGASTKRAGGHSSVVWVASCCKKAPFRKHRRRYHKRCLFRIMEVINCSFIHIYKQSNRVIPSLGRKIGNVGTYMQRQNHKCCQSSEYKLQKAFENGVWKLPSIEWICQAHGQTVFYFCFHVFFFTSTQQKENSLNLFSYFTTHSSMAWKLLLYSPKYIV